MMHAASAFGRLFDDAAIFPPGNVPMRAAVQQHGGYRGGPLAPLVGPFVCSLARLPELAAALAELDQRLDVAVVAPPGPISLEASTRMQFVAIEQVVNSDDELVTCPGPIARFVEFPVLPWHSHHLAPLAVAGMRVKFRTGGVTADAFPSEDTLAAAICAAVEAGVAFKCTAGLHNAVRHTAEDGFEHHGFLNVLLAAHAATDRMRPPAVAEILGDRDGARLAASLRALSAGDVACARRAFLSFGTCSITEPVGDLQRLGLLA
jgi:hypothetical protein